MDLTGKVAIITGGAKGLGKGFARGLLQRGAQVVLADIDVAEGQAVCAEFQQEFGHRKASFVECDVSKTKDFQRLFLQTKQVCSQIDIVVNNAGILDELEIRKVIDINLVGVIEGTNLAIHYMKKENGGRGGLIVNIGSSAGLIPVPYPVYAAAKTGVVIFTRSLAGRASDTTDQDIRVTCLCPSFVKTQIADWEKSVETEGLLKQTGIMQVERVIEALMNMVDHPSNNGGIYTVSPEIMRYKYPYHLRGKL